MGITKGTLLLRGKKWAWKYRVDGKTRWETLPDNIATERAAEYWRDARLQLYHESASAYTSEIKLAHLCDRYEAHCREYYQRDGEVTSTISEVVEALKPLRAKHSATAAAKFSPNMLRTVREEWIVRSLARPTVNRYTARVVMMFKWAASHELIAPTVRHALSCVERLKRGRSAAKETEPRRPVPEAHIARAKEFLPSPVRALIELQLYTGARSGELVGLRPIDIDTTGAIWESRPTKHKTAHHGHVRTVVFGPKAQELLRPLMASRALDAYLFDPREAVAERAAAAGDHRRENQKPNKRKTERRVGEHYTVASYRKAIERACEKANANAIEKGKPLIAPWNPHRLRHNVATSIRKQYGLEMAQVYLGHARAEVTEIYADANRAKAWDLAKEIG